MRLFLGGLHHSAADSDALIHTFVRPDSGPRNPRLGQGNGAVIAPLSRRDQNSALVMTVENFADGSVFEHRVDRIGDDAGNRKHFDFVRLLFRRKRKGVGHNDL